MNDVMLEYLYHVQKNRRSPWEFVVVFKDYSNTAIDDIHEFHLDTLRKPIIGIAIHIPGEDWKVWFLNPFGVTIEKTVWNKERAVAYVKFHHNQLVAQASRIPVKEVVLSDVGNYVNPIN